MCFLSKPYKVFFWVLQKLAIKRQTLHSRLDIRQKTLVIDIPIHSKTEIKKDNNKFIQYYRFVQVLPIKITISS